MSAIKPLLSAAGILLKKLTTLISIGIEKGVFVAKWPIVCILLGWSCENVIAIFVMYNFFLL